MFLNLVKLALFAIVNCFGFFIVALIHNAAVKFHWLPDQLSITQYNTMLQLLEMFYIPWGVAALASVGFFFTQGEIRAWLILAPLYVPALYGFGILAYFHFV